MAMTGIVTLSGVASAPAAEYTVLCKAAEAPCKQAYAEGEKIVGESANPQFEAIVMGLSFYVTCKKSKFEALTGAEKGAPRLEGIVTDVSFDECKTDSGKTCNVGGRELAWWFHLEHTAGQNGRVTVSEKAAGQVPGAELVCEGGFLTCAFDVAEEDEELFEIPVGNFDATGGNTFPQIHANALALEGIGKCTIKEAFFNADYVVSKPLPLWVSYVE